MRMGCPRPSSCNRSMAHPRVFLDTNVIIECFRIGVWGELSRGHRLETVDEVVTEAMTGDSGRRDRVAVGRDALLEGLSELPHVVVKAERNQLLLQYPNGPSLDPGERDLFAYLNSHALPLAQFVVVGTADKGAIAFSHLPGWLDQLVSLEELLVSAKTSRAKLAMLGPQHQTSFLNQIRMKVRMGVIP